MSVFNFMETFFFISLGITFILILLLVYHFKQRLSNVEQKSDTMLDIVNNVVKEMGVIKVLASSRPVVQQHPLSAFMDNQRPLNDTFSKMSMNNIEVNEVNISEKDVAEVQEIHLAEPEEYDSDDEEEYDSDDEEEEDEKVVVSDDEEEPEEDEVEQYLEPEEEEETLEEEDVKVIQEAEEVLEEQPIVVNKLEPEDVEVLSEESVEDPMEEYKKLAPAALKALIISKGYATDVAKMKKPQLLQILEENL
jgi:hypothetical protein